MKKSLVMAGVLSALLSVGATGALAHGDEVRDCGGPGKMEHHGKGGPKGMRGAKMMEREFSADEIRTLAEARLIMRGNDNLKVGKIKMTDSGYTINIVTRDGSLVEEREVAKNGMPLEMYEHLQKRMEKRMEKRQERG